MVNEEKQRTRSIRKILRLASLLVLASGLSILKRSFSSLKAELAKIELAKEADKDKSENIHEDDSTRTAILHPHPDNEQQPPPSDGKDPEDPPLAGGFHFSPEILDFKAALEYTPCGKYKCFFREKGGEFGHVVAQKKWKEIAYVKEQEKAYEFAEKLVAEYGIRHLIGPTQTFNISADFASKLNTANFINTANDHVMSESRFHKGRTVVSRVKTAPSSARLLKRKQLRSPRRFLNTLLKEQPKNSNATRLEFLQTLEGESKRTASLVREYGCLANDFQLMIDAEGRIWHLDLDRCFKWKGSKIILNYANPDAVLKSFGYWMSEVDRAHSKEFRVSNTTTEQQ